jgi:flagellar biosynthetic protein FlhB
MAMRRMMQEVPTASVVITNPTHFAVALKYKQDMTAPVVVAKGQDFIAAKIKEIARKNKVAVVENKFLARALYSGADVGDVIPPHLYQAVAEVLAYVYRLNKKLS